jgi:hypothetical protein
MKHIVSFSTGLSSALTVERVLARYGKEATTVVFMDTKIEDEDNYRFMDDCRRRWDVPIVVLAEGRTPYQVFTDQHVIPNSLVAPCTQKLKIGMFTAWLETQSKPITIHIGYDFTEIDRCEKTQRAYEKLGHSVDFPLLWQPYEYRRYSVIAREEWGIEPPLMYSLGYTHANCGGRCVKQGQGDWIRTLINFPERYMAAEDWEEGMRAQGEPWSNYAICKDQSNGEVTAITLREIRKRYEESMKNKIPLNLAQLDYRSACVVCGVGA